MVRVLGAGTAQAWQDDMVGSLLLLDTASLYYRAFYGMPETVTAPDGTPVNAIRGQLGLASRNRPGAPVAHRRGAAPPVRPYQDHGGRSMNANNKATDYDVLRAVSDSLSRVPVAGPPQPEAVMARGHDRQRRRRVYGMAVHLLSGGDSLVTGGKAGRSMVIDPSGISSGVTSGWPFPNWTGVPRAFSASWAAWPWCA